MNNSGEPGLFTSRACRRCKASAHEAVVFHREWAATKQMRLDRLAVREKMPIMIERESNKKSDSLDLVIGHANKQISLKVSNGIGIFYK
jgi:hypothetical protein